MGVLHGTTTVGLKLRDSVVIAADKRASQGYFIAHKRVRKIIKIDDHVVMSIAGLVADAQILASQLQYLARKYKYEEGVQVPVRTLVSYLGLLLNTYKYFPFEVQLLIGGYDTEPRLYAVQWFGDYTEENYAVTGSGSPVAIGLIESRYSPDLDVNEAVKLALEAIRASTRRDVFSGEGVDVAVVRKGSVEISTLSLG
ncbi:MAG: proteasome subunit beta [Thermoprotei archaeon]